MGADLPAPAEVEVSPFSAEHTYILYTNVYPAVKVALLSKPGGHPNQTLRLHRVHRPPGAALRGG